MARDPGESTDAPGARAARELDQPPSARYVSPATSTAGAARASAVGPIAQAATVAVAGAAALVGVGAILASTAGLLFVSGVTGAGVGLVLARARVPSDSGTAPLSRRAVTWLAILIALGAVVAAGVATWLIARDLGGTLGVVDYLLATFGPFVVGEAIIATVAAAWGAGAGPIQR